MARLTKAQREAEAEEVRAALPNKPGDKVIDDFMAARYEMIRSSFRSVWADKGGKKQKVVEVLCGGCLSRSIFPYAKTDYDEAETCCHWNIGSAWDEYGFYDERDDCIKITNSQFLCPVCGRFSTVYSWARLKYSDLASMHRKAQEIINVRGHLVVILWDLGKCIDREGKEDAYYQKLSASFQIDGRMFRANGYDVWNGNKYYTEQWYLKSSFREIFGGIKKELTYWDPSKLEGAEEYNDGIITYLQSHDKGAPIYAERYLSLWAKAPNIENVAKSFPGYTFGLIVGTPYNETIYHRARRFLDLKKKRPHEICGVEKAAAKAVLESAAGPENVWLYRLLRSHGAPDPERVLKIYVGKAQSIITFLEDETVKKIKPPVVKTISYLEKNKYNTITLRDYWKMTDETEGGVDACVMFPRNLQAAHDRAVERYEAKKNKAQDQKIAERAKKLEKYVFRDEDAGLLIRPVRSTAELILEGKKLQHCVGSYAQKVARGDTSIFFIRRITAPKIPFYTLEYRGGKIIQDHGLKNVLQTPEITAFENAWLNYIKGGKKNGKQLAAKTAERAGA